MTEDQLRSHPYTWPGGTLFVSWEEGDNRNDGKSWSTAKKTPPENLMASCNCSRPDRNCGECERVAHIFGGRVEAVSREEFERRYPDKKEPWHPSEKVVIGHPLRQRSLVGVLDRIVPPFLRLLTIWDMYDDEGVADMEKVDQAIKDANEAAIEETSTSVVQDEDPGWVINRPSKGWEEGES
jgi:hypothetical protein